MYDLLREYFPVAMLLILLVSAIFALIVGPKMRAAKKSRQKTQERNAKIATENDRIAQLPKLDTQWLLRMPDDHANALYGVDRSAVFRTFANRYNRLIVIDHEGNCWVGLFNRQTLESLRASEYEQCDHYVPFRGAGESYAGPVVKMPPDNLVIDIYPVWLSHTQVASDQDWTNWANLERRFDREFAEANYQTVFAEILPTDFRLRVKRQREEYAQLLKQQVS